MNQMTHIREDAGTAGSRTLKKALLATAAVVAVGIGGARFLHGGSEATAAASPAAIVQVAVPLSRKVTQWDEYVGRFAASDSVEVRPRVSGAVMSLHFKDGQVVQKGQILFTIDPRPYRAALAEARSGVASAESAVALARADYQRAARLTGDDAVSASEVDALHSKVQAATAALAAARARQDARALDVEFTEVRAPIAGRISDRRIDPGNLVIGGDGTAATLLTTINALDPIYFAFDASEALFLKEEKQKAGGGDVEIRLQNDTGYRWKGRLDFTDTGVDPRSGTIRARAIIRNPELKLRPGLFGNMRMSNAGTVTALLVPDAAVQTDQADKAVLTVGPDDVVALKKVVLGPQVDGLRIIAAGIGPNDRVIVGGNIAAAPGAKVSPRPGSIVPKAGQEAASLDPAAASATLASN